MKEDQRELDAAIRALEAVAREDDGFDAGDLEPSDIALVLEELDSLRRAGASQERTDADAIVITAFTTLLIQMDPSGCVSSSADVDLCLERARRVANRYKEALESEAYRAERARKLANEARKQAKK